MGNGKGSKEYPRTEVVTVNLHWHYTALRKKIASIVRLSQIAKAMHIPTQNPYHLMKVEAEMANTATMTRPPRVPIKYWLMKAG